MARQLLPRPRPRHDAEALPRRRQLADVVAVLALQQRVEMQRQRQLDGLARGAGGGDHDDPPSWGLGGEEGLGVGGEKVIAGGLHAANIQRRAGTLWRPALPQAVAALTNRGRATRAATRGDAGGTPAP